MLLARSAPDIFLSTVDTCMSFPCFHARHNVVSSAYCKHSLSDVIWDISATHRLINIGPIIKPCGTPNSDVNVRQFVQNAVEKLNNSLPNIKSRMLNVCIFCINA